MLRWAQWEEIHAPVARCGDEKHRVVAVIVEVHVGLDGCVGRVQCKRRGRVVRALDSRIARGDLSGRRDDMTFDLDGRIARMQNQVGGAKRLSMKPLSVLLSTWRENSSYVNANGEVAGLERYTAELDRVKVCHMS